MVPAVAQSLSALPAFPAFSTLPTLSGVGGASAPLRTPPLGLGGVVRSALLGALAGFLAAAAMNFSMSRQPEGFAPAYVAASVVRRRSPAETRFRDAVVAHHAAGALVGGTYGVSFAVAGAALPAFGRIAGGVDLLSHVLSVAAVVAFVYAFFAHVVLPRAGGVVYEEQATAVRGQWLRSTLVFGAALAVVGPLLLAVAG
jgi:hypothetical protein